MMFFSAMTAGGALAPPKSLGALLLCVYAPARTVSKNCCSLQHARARKRACTTYMRQHDCFGARGSRLPRGDTLCFGYARVPAKMQRGAEPAACVLE
jgi:hypothetical protein